jgi:hypothetical protein
MSLLIEVQGVFLRALECEYAVALKREPISNIWAYAVGSRTNEMKRLLGCEEALRFAINKKESDIQLGFHLFGPCNQFVPNFPGPFLVQCTKSQQSNIH